MDNTKVFEDFKKEFNFQSELKESISILEGGKGFRAKLISLLANIFEIDSKKSKVIMDVTESLHTATLVHDDVIDNAELRRGKTSLNKVIDNKKSILLGDYYLAKTIQKITELESVELVHSISGVLSSLVEGEWIQASLINEQWNLSEYRKVAEHKTGSIFSWCLQSVLTVKFGHLNQPLINKIGNDIGYLFQIIDDYLDFKGDDKTPFADLKNGNINYFILKMKELDLNLAEDHINQSLETCLDHVREDIMALRDNILKGFQELLTKLPDNMNSESRNLMFSKFVDELANRYKN